MKGFFIALQELALDHGLSQTERLFASVITGREMKTKWRSKMYVHPVGGADQRLIPEDQKDGVRQRLLAFLEEPDLAVCLSIGLS